MKTKTNYTFPEQYRLEAEEYISYKHSLGFVFGYDDQKKCDQLLRYLYTNSPINSVTELTKDLVDGYLEQFNNSRPRTIHANQSYVRQYGLFLKQRGYMPYIYPATLIQCPKDFTPYIFSKEEIYQILKCADNIGPNKNKFVNAPHGSRIGETVQLKAEDVDLSEGLITFHNGKNNISRIIPISDSLASYLKKFDSRIDRTGNGYFFPSLHGECYSPITIRNTFRNLMIQAGIPVQPNGKYPRIHDLRYPNQNKIQTFMVKAVCTLFFLSIKVWILFCLLVVFLQNYKGGFAMDLSHLQGHYEELLNSMEQKGYSDTYISRFREEIQRILKRADDNAWESYRDIYKEYEQIPHSNDYLRNKRTIIGALEQFDINGLFPDGRRRHSLSDRGSYHLLLPEFKELIDFYSDAERKRGKKESTIYVEAHNAASFLFHMQLRGCSSLETVAEEDVLSFFSTETGENIRSCSYRKNISAVLKAGKAWKKTECQRLLAFLPMLREKRKNIQYLTDGEMADIRSAAALGRLSLRDTAIVYLLIYTGLRGCDIAALTLDSVDWSRDVLHICQQKTNEPLEIPLLPVVGNAIFDYLQSGRPIVDDPHLFLRETKHYTSLCSRSIGSIVATVLKTLGIRQNSGNRKGTHIFRHNLAATLLGNGIPRPVISQTLGHSSPDSLEPYLRADFIHLKECSISIASFPVGKGVFGK